jgi:hypothetical protein
LGIKTFQTTCNATPAFLCLWEQLGSMGVQPTSVLPSGPAGGSIAVAGGK